MSPSCSITKRVRVRATDGKRTVRYVVRYRLGGKFSRPQHAGSFKTRAEAETRKRWIAGEIAAMRTPDLGALGRVEETPTVPELAHAWLAGRHDLTHGSKENYRPALKRIDEWWEGTQVGQVTPRMVSDWIGEMMDEGTGRTVIDRCMAAVRQTLDEHLDPNPARHRSVKLPKTTRVEANPPPFSHWQLILDGVTGATRLPLRILEGTGLRTGELVALCWQDVDAPGSRLFVRAGKTPAARRWVPVPPGLMMDIDALRPREEREPEDHVIPGLLGGTLRMAMRRACRTAGIPLYSPHDLRHRYITLLVRRGMDISAVSALAGHTRKSMTLDVYSHLLVDEENR
jgi:integrase